MQVRSWLARRTLDGGGSCLRRQDKSGPHVGAVPRPVRRVSVAIPRRWVEVRQARTIDAAHRVARALRRALVRPDRHVICTNHTLVSDACAADRSGQVALLLRTVEHAVDRVQSRQPIQQPGLDCRALHESVHRRGIRGPDAPVCAASASFDLPRQVGKRGLQDLHHQN